MGNDIGLRVIKIINGSNNTDNIMRFKGNV